MSLKQICSKNTVATADIDDAAVTYAKIQDVSVTDRLLGRDTVAAGDVEELAVGGGLEFTGAGGIQRSALTGDVTATAGGNATTIANDAVTYAKIQNVSATDKVLGRSTAGAGDVEEIACTAAGRALLDDADAGTQRTTLGLGTTDTPQLLRLGLGAAADANAKMKVSGQYLSASFAQAGTDVNWNNGNVQTRTLTAGVTFTFSNGIAGARYALILTQDTTGSRLVTWPASVKWPGGTAPTLTTTGDKKDAITFLYDGTNYLGSSSLNY